MQSRIWVTDPFELKLKNARRLIRRWRDFYQCLSEAGSSSKGIDLEPVEQAYQYICGSNKRQLVKKIPYTGDEFWSAVTKGGSNETVTFTMSELWMILVYTESDEFWYKIEKELKSVPSAREKRERLHTLREKLQLAGYLDDLIPFIQGQVDEQDFEDAERWFYLKRLPSKGGGFE